MSSKKMSLLRVLSRGCFVSMESTIENTWNTNPITDIRREASRAFLTGLLLIGSDEKSSSEMKQENPAVIVAMK